MLLESSLCEAKTYFSDFQLNHGECTKTHVFRFQMGIMYKIIVVIRVDGKIQIKPAELRM